MAITISNWINFLLLYYIAYIKNFMYLYKSSLFKIFAIFIISAIMGVITFILHNQFLPDNNSYMLVMKILILTGIISSAILLYFILLLMTRLISIKTIKSYIHK